MTKSIRYEIIQINNVVVFHQKHYTGKLKTVEIESVHHGIAVIYLSSNTKAPCSSFDMGSKDDALILINEIHTAMHKEFVGEWEPVPGNEYLFYGPDVKRNLGRYIGPHSGGYVVALERDGDSYKWFESCERNWIVPQGPCEVCYEIEGCKDGVQEEPRSNLDDLLDQFGDQNLIPSEYLALSKAIKADKKNPVIRLDGDILDESLSYQGPYSKGDFQADLEKMGYQVEWIGGDA